MMGPGVLPGREKVHRFQMAGIAGIQDGHAIAEHVTDIEVIAVRHDLDAVRTPTNVAVGNMLDPVTNPFWWNRPVLGAGHIWHPGQRHHAQHAPQLRAAAHLLHDLLPPEVEFLLDNLTPGRKAASMTPRNGKVIARSKAPILGTIKTATAVNRSYLACGSIPTRTPQRAVAARCPR